MADQNDIERLGRRGRRLKDLRKRVKSRRDGEVIIDGRRLVSDLVRWGVPIRELYLVPEISREFEAMGWREAAERVFELESSVLADIAPTKNPQGVLAIAEEPPRQEWPADDGVALWLDRIQASGLRACCSLRAAPIPTERPPFVVLRGQSFVSRSSAISALQRPSTG